MRAPLSIRMVALLVALALHCLAGCGADAEVDPEYLKAVSALTKSKVVDPVDPDLYQTQIEAIETDLFGTGPFTDVDRARLSSGFDGLGKLVLAADPAPLSQVFGRELVVFGKRIANADDALARSRLAAREQWRRIRGSLFFDAFWFR